MWSRDHRSAGRGQSLQRGRQVHPRTANAARYLGRRAVLGNQGQPTVCGVRTRQRECESACPSRTPQPPAVTAVCTPTPQGREPVPGHTAGHQGLRGAGLVAPKPSFSFCTYGRQRRGKPCPGGAARLEKPRATILEQILFPGPPDGWLSGTPQSQATDLPPRLVTHACPDAVLGVHGQLPSVFFFLCPLGPPGARSPRTSGHRLARREAQARRPRTSPRDDPPRSAPGQGRLLRLTRTEQHLYQTRLSCGMSAAPSLDLGLSVSAPVTISGSRDGDGA